MNNKTTLFHRDSTWEEYQKLLSMFDRVGVPQDSRWRSLLLYFRDIKDYSHLTDAQKVAIQGLLTSLLEEKDYSAQRLDAILKSYHTIIAKPYQNKVEALLREVSDVIAGFHQLLAARSGDLSSLEEETITIVSDEIALDGDHSASIAKLRSAFSRVKNLLEIDIRNLEHMATRDGITNLANRRAFDIFMEGATNRWLKEGRPMALALFDIDHFKRFNDEHGHRIGDQVLAVVGTHLKNALAQFGENNDVLAARYGGEEFALVISGPGVSELAVATDECRNAIKKFNFLIRDSEGNVIESGLHITVSAGVASAWSGWQSAHIENLVDSADRALYFAKQSGRDKVVEFIPDNEVGFSIITPSQGV